MMSIHTFQKFEEAQALKDLKHYLPHQNPLKDFINDNMLKPFQNLAFHEALEVASTNFGYKTYSSLEDYRQMYESGKIDPKILQKILTEQKGIEEWESWQDKMRSKRYDTSWRNRLGQMHQLWTNVYHLNIEKEVHSFLFRIVGSYIDQGVALKQFPKSEGGFLASIRVIEKNSLFVKIFKSKRVRKLLADKQCTLKDLLKILVGTEEWYAQYLFDQQFAHAGWSGMVAVLEDYPEELLDRREISLYDFIFFEMLLEIDALDRKFGAGRWLPLQYNLPDTMVRMFEPVAHSELFEVYALWQEAYEWSFYDQVLRGLQLTPALPAQPARYAFQAVFCIDERECSLRRYVEEFGEAQTFGTAGFFGVEFYFQPEGGKFFTKSCPAPVTPKFLVQEVECKHKHHKKDVHFSHQSEKILGGWIIAQTMGFWNAIELAWNIFKPTETSAQVSSFRHMDKDSKLRFEYNPDLKKVDNGLQIGFTLTEMTDRLENVLRSIGLTQDFASLVYFVGHGASSVNNTHYAAYDCGACSGRAGSVNARVIATIANKPEVRAILRDRGINIPDGTRFVGGLHDTTKDEILFYDLETLPAYAKPAHKSNAIAFEKSLAYNAKERARRFLLIDHSQNAKKVHKEVRLRALSLFEPRSEWDHATNAMCIVGRRATNKHLFLDRRSFLNSYDYAQDREGKYLLGIMRAVAPVCGGINLQYYFSKVDNHRLGAGSKLPHNVIGLIGVANGMEGDLRIGLPKQALDIHDAIRLLVVVEHFPEVVLQTIQKEAPTYEWFVNNWVHLVVIHPETKALYRFQNGAWQTYEPATRTLPAVKNFGAVLEGSTENLPIYLIG